MTAQNPQELPKGIYEHYKGNRYRVMDVARHSETEEWMVIYKALYKTESGDQTLWVRPLTMFTEQVLVNGKGVPRFRYIGLS